MDQPDSGGWIAANPTNPCSGPFAISYSTACQTISARALAPRSRFSHQPIMMMPPWSCNMAEPLIWVTIPFNCVWIWPSIWMSIPLMVTPV